nr:glycosyltransferase family 2 protein [bacterium]
ILSWIGKMLYGNVCGDFHCGLRAVKRSIIKDLNLHTDGMEFATEMIISAALKHKKISEVPITLYPDGRNRPPHLRRVRDALRHIKLMLTYTS